MSSYTIKPYSLKQAAKLGVTIKASSNASKKLDVFKNGDKIASIGSSNYNDFPTWIEKEGLEYAKQRRKLYKIRHEKNRHKKGSEVPLALRGGNSVSPRPGYYASNILW